MNYRQRYLETARFGKPDRLFYAEHNPTFPLTLKRWRAEGFPPDVYPRTFFGLDRYEVLPVSVGPVPPFEERTIEETDAYRVYTDRDGTTLKEFKNRDLGMNVSYQFLEFPVKTKSDFHRVRDRYNPSSAMRVPEFWDSYVQGIQGRDYPIRLNIEGMFWWVRKMMGLEGLCTAVYDDPELVGQMMSFSVDYQLQILRRVLRRNIADYAVIFEDLAYKNGPLISPALVRRLMLPGYRKITSCLRDFGIDVIIVDSDGDVSSVIPIWHR